jgi:hypothetical protein
MRFFADIKKAITGNIVKCLLIFFLLFSFSNSFSQFYNGSQLTFGKNRVQYDDRFWSFFRFEKFDTYFYIGGKQLAIYTAKYADKCLKDIEKKLDYELGDKVQFIIFNKFSDLKQSNIGYQSNENYNIGGVTHIVGSKVFLYFDGNHKNFEKQIRAGIAKIIITEMIYGSKITAMIKNSALMNIPDWYLNGLVSYISEDWNTSVDNYIRDNILRGYFKKFYSLSGDDAVLAGHAMWKFIADKYGAPAVSNIIYMTKISRNTESGFMFVLGISFKNLLNDMVAYYEQQYADFEKQSTKNENETLLKKQKANTVYSQFRISPDGKYSAYVTNEWGQYKVLLLDNETKKIKCLLKKDPKLEEKTDVSYPLLAWHPSSKILSIIFENKGKTLLYFYSPDDKTMDKQQLFNIEKILDFSYSQNGKMLAVSGVNLGQSDIYVYNLASHTFEQITKDIYDDLNPRFINNSSELLFSSNRPNDSIKYTNAEEMNSITAPLENVSDRYDIFLYDYNKRKPVLRKVTDTPDVNELFPMQYSKRYLTYLSDQNGVFNRYIARLDSAISFIDTATHYRYFTTSFPITNYNRNILEQDVNPLSDKISEISFDNGEYKMIIEQKTPVNELKGIKLPKTYYINQVETALKNKGVETVDPLKEDIENIKSKKNKKTKKISNVLLNEVAPSVDTTNIDINNYQFGTQQVDGGSDSNAVRKKLFLLPRQENYNVEYSINSLVGQIDFNYLNASYQKYVGGNSPIFLNPGFNALFQVGVIDLLEDYRITGGFRVAVSFDNFEYFISFDNYKKRLDKTITFYRQTLQAADDYSLFKIHSNSLYYILKWPFSSVLSLKGTASVRYDKTVFLSTDIQNLKEPNLNEYWAGIKGELTFDNTRDRGINLFYGTRWKIFGEYYQKFTDKFNNLVVLGLDVRKYTKISKTFIWANRLAASTSFGNNTLIYYLGGVDNWMIPKFNNEINVSQRKNWAYQTLATNLRGFTQNIRNGNSFVVINSELRFPIFKFFAKKPIRSEFISNFQFIGFGDVGTAWTGWDPFSEENTKFKQTIQQGPIKITIINERDPIVGGIGLGARTKLLGYFIRADYAWGIENLAFQSGVFYISLGLDF